MNIELDTIKKGLLLDFYIEEVAKSLSATLRRNMEFVYEDDVSEWILCLDGKPLAECSVENTFKEKANECIFSLQGKIIITRTGDFKYKISLS